MDTLLNVNQGNQKKNKTKKYKKIISHGDLNNQNKINSDKKKGKMAFSKRKFKYEDYDKSPSKKQNCPNINSQDQISNPQAQSDCPNRSLVCYDDQIFGDTRTKPQKINGKNVNAAKKNKGANFNKIKNNKIPRNQSIANLDSKMELDEMNNANVTTPQYYGYTANILDAAPLFDSFNYQDQPSKGLKRKHEDSNEDERNSKVRKVGEGYCFSPLNSDGSTCDGEKQELPKIKKNEPMSNKVMKKIEKSRLFKEKMKERQIKEATHVQGVEKKVPCKFYVNGCCKYLDCTFSHDVPQPKKDEQCKFFVMAQCTKGDDCLYRHGEWPCKFFHAKMGCKIANCKFSHEPLTEISQKWLDKILEEEKAKMEAKVAKSEEEAATADSLANFYGTNSRCLPEEMIESNESDYNEYENSDGSNLTAISDNIMTQHPPSKPLPEELIARPPTLKSISENITLQPVRIHKNDMDCTRFGTNGINPPGKCELPRNLFQQNLNSFESFNGNNVQNHFQTNVPANISINNFNLIGINCPNRSSLFEHFKDVILSHRMKTPNNDNELLTTNIITNHSENALPLLNSFYTTQKTDSFQPINPSNDLENNNLHKYKESMPKYLTPFTSINLYQNEIIAATKPDESMLNKVMNYSIVEDGGCQRPPINSQPEMFFHEPRTETLGLFSDPLKFLSSR